MVCIWCGVIVWCGLRVLESIMRIKCVYLFTAAVERAQFNTVDMQHYICSISHMWHAQLHKHTHTCGQTQDKTTLKSRVNAYVFAAYRRKMVYAYPFDVGGGRGTCKNARFISNDQGCTYAELA